MMTLGNTIIIIIIILLLLLLYSLFRQKHFLTSRVHPPHSLLGVGGARVWSPDRDGIDEELEIIKRRCQLDPDNILR